MADPRVLVWAPNVQTDKSIDKFVLLVLECGAVGAAHLRTFGDVRNIIGCSDRTLRQAVSRLEARGHIAFASRVPATIEFGPYVLELERAIGSMTDDPWQIMRAKVFAYKGCQCVYCGRDASHVDHIVPRSLGGPDALENLVPACARCNLEKGSRSLDEWRGAT